VIDIGGGSGVFLTGILAQHAEMRGVLLDQPQVVEHAQVVVQDAGMAQRCELVGGSFLEDVPEGGDAYICKHVLRDWDDANVATILSNCHRAMRADAALLVIDAVVDPRNSRDRIVKLLDLEQMFWLNGALRTLDEWQSLLTAAGFQLVHTRSTEIVDAVILEAVKEA
jgi:cyclopropane fatty-acyl-phospholipid synthase-like methyltransferase